MLVLPLLIGGFVWSTLAVPKRSIKLFCQQFMGVADTCQSIADDDSFDGLVDDPKTLFSVRPKSGSSLFHHYYIMTTPRHIGVINISNAKNLQGFPGQYPNAVQLVEKLNNINAFMSLTGTYYSQIINNEWYLNCNELLIDYDNINYNTDNEHTVYCNSQEWSGLFEVQAFDAAQENITKLEQAVRRKIERFEHNYIVDKSIVTLLPLVVYLLLSALVWIVIRAYRFVKAG